MRVAMVTSGNFPPDVRIEKEAQVLSQEGHEISVFTPRATVSNTVEPSFNVVEYGFQTVPWANSRRLRHLFKESLVDLVHLQDTPGSLQAYLAAKSLGLKVIYDIHEIWPSLVLENSHGVSSGTALWSASLRIEEALAFAGANVSLTVIDEASDYFVRKYKLSDGGLPVRNFESLRRFESIRPSQDLNDAEDFIVTYVGGLDGPIRGIEEVLLAAALLSKKSVRFLIVGAGFHMRWLERLAEELNLKKSVRFLGSKRFRDAMEIIAASDLCLVPHRNCISTHSTLPHKISQYMALRKPVVSTNLAPIMRLFHSAFIPWEPRTPQKLVELINSARDDSSEAQKIAQRGYKLVSEKYRWEDEGKRLVTIYESLSPR